MLIFQHPAQRGASLRFPIANSALLLGICAFPAAAQSSSHPTDAALIRRINEYIRPLAVRELSGTLLVARGNRILIERSFGFSNYELGVKFTPTTPTNVASITKPLTIIIAARMQDEKRLSWKDTVS